MTSLLYSRATSSLQRWCRRILHKRGLYRWQFRRDPNLLLERSNSYVFPPSSASGCFSCVTGAVTAPCLLLSSPMSGACHLGPSTQSQLESVQHGGSAVGYTNAAQLKKNRPDGCVWTPNNQRCLWASLHRNREQLSANTTSAEWKRAYKKTSLNSDK